MVNLRVFSNFSLGESILKPADIVRLAKSQCQSAVAMIDRMNMFGALEFSTYAVKEKVKPILGCLLKIHNYGYLPVFIKNRKGYEEVSETITTFYLENQEFITIEQFVRMKNVIVLWGGEESQYIDTEDFKLKAEFLHNAFGNNLYLEVQDVNNTIKNNILRTALELHIPIVYTHNTYFEEGKFEAYYTFTCICEGKLYSSEEMQNNNKKNNYFYSSQLLEEQLSIPEAISNSEDIAIRCNFYLKPTPPMIPEFVKEEEAGAVLTKLVNDKLNMYLSKQIESNMHGIYYARLAKELDVIISRGFANYFLVTHDFVNKAKNMGVPVGPGRGSGTGCLVSYSLGITNVDPIKFGLIFERFLNPERISMPDLDLDFDQERRDLVIQYLREKYGEENVAHIITFGTMKSRIVVRDVGRVLMVPLKQVDSICKFIPQDQVRPVTLKEAVSFDKKLVEMFQVSELTKKLLDISIQLEGLVRHTSLHAAGIAIYKTQTQVSDHSSLSTHVPLYRVSSKDPLCTQFSMKYVEMAGLVKFDFLGLQTLTLIRKTVELVKTNHQIDIDIDNIPHDDKQTFIFINQLNLAGVFQLDSAGMKTVIYSLKPDCLDDIIAIISLYRPGPMKFIPQYGSNKADPSKITYLHEMLEPILRNTYGIIVYQEQVLEIAVKCAGYTLGEADNLRRAMGKKVIKEMEEQEAKFISGAIAKGLTEKVAKELFSRINEFAGYGFNKSHAAPYGLISYITAYLKCHYPLEFMSSLMNLDKQDTHKIIIYVNDMKRMGITILPPSINKSEFNFSIESHEKKQIRFGFSPVKNVGESFAQAIVDERNKQGSYTSIDNFIHRNLNHLNKRQLEFLIYSGAFTDLKINPLILIENLGNLAKGEAILDSNQNNLAELEEKYQPNYWEMESLGFFLTHHPMESEDLKFLNLVTIDNLLHTEKERGTVKMCGVVYDLLKKKTHHNNKTYMFVTLFDTTGMFEVTLFSETLEKYLHLLEKKVTLVMDVTFEKKQNIIKLTCLNVMKFEDYKQSLCTSLYIQANSKKIPIIASILEPYNTGSNYLNKVILQYRGKNYLLPYYIRVTREILSLLREHNIDFIF